jgi:hypothetical protein
MKVCIVLGVFGEHLSYQENVWARQLAEAGHHVRVIVGEGASSGPGTAGGDGAEEYEIRRLPILRLPRAIQITTQLGDAIAEYGPDLILWFAAAQHFGWAICRDDRLAGVPVVTFYSDHYGMHEYDYRKRGISLRQRIWAFGFHVLRGGVMRAALRRSRVIVANTPDTREILLLVVPRAERPEIDRKILHVPLGFDPDKCFRDASLSRSVRAELGIAPRDVLVCLSSRFDPDKAPILEPCLEGIHLAMEEVAELRALVVGMGPGATADRFRRRIAEGPFPERFVCEGFVDTGRLTAFYNASDICVFGRASISCQEALATGLFACFADEAALRCLVRSEGQAAFFRRGDARDLSARLAAVAQEMSGQPPNEREGQRQARTERSRWLGYDRIVPVVLDRLNP